MAGVDAAGEAGVASLRLHSQLGHGLDTGDAVAGTSEGGEIAPAPTADV